MRLTVSQYTFEAIPLEGTFAICHAMGFKGVVVGAFKNRGNGGYDPDAIAADPQQWADHLNALLDKYEMECVDFFPQFALSFAEQALNHPNEAIRESVISRLRGIIQFCKLTHTHGLTVLPGAPFLERTQEENIARSAQMLQRVAEMAGEDGITIYWEPHMGSVAPEPELALRIVEKAPDATIALDYSHFVVQYIDPARVHPLIPYAGTVHIRAAKPGKIQTHYKDSTIDYVDVVKRLQAAGYDDCVTVEYVCADWFGANEADTLYETMVTKAALEPYVPVR
jgi:sugar phosphate isomerase/epimerase